MVEENNTLTPHEIVLKDRNSLEVQGVLGIESFDNEEFLLKTDCGYLGIRGQDLSIQNLDLEVGFVSIEGNIADVSYLDVGMPREEKRKSMLRRFFG